MKPSHPEIDSASNTNNVGFEFVVNNGLQDSQVRRHAMRVSWNARKRQNSRRTQAVRALAPATQTTSNLRPLGEVHNKSHHTQVPVSRKSPRSNLAFPVTRNKNKRIKTTEKQKTIKQEALLTNSPVSRVASQHRTAWVLQPPRLGLDFLDQSLSPTIGSGTRGGLLSYPFSIKSQDQELVHHCSYSLIKPASFHYIRERLQVMNAKRIDTKRGIYISIFNLRKDSRS